MFAGQKIPVGTKPCVIGRDPQVANLVYPVDSRDISKRHCQLRCDETSECLYLQDTFSSNGTFFGAGQRIEPGQTRELRSGDRFYLGVKENMFEVTRE